MTDEQKRIDFLDNRLSPKVAQDFPGALALVQKFLDANPGYDHWQRVQLLGRAGFLLYINTPDAKRAAIAAPSLQVIDDELRQVEADKTATPDDRARDIKDLSHNKIMILLEAKRTAEAAKILDQFWPLVLRSTDYTGGWCWHWRQVHNGQGQPGQAVDGLIKAFNGRVLWRDIFPSEIALSINDELLSQDKSDDALSWAKLDFMLCPFREGDIADATKAVTRSLSAGELSVAKANSFALAQTDAAAPNPLDKVPLPRLDTKAIRAQLADPDAKMSTDTRLTCLLLVGDFRGAMVLAKSRLVADVGNQDNALEVARVFKAKDGDIARANGFLAYYQQGQGENPIPAFLKETQATATTATTP